ncbi:MAG: hypothetical protein FWG34_09725 [Oscillospiraceae bacterium]|nr:hypothetical protein [Oscillospiraceae bacterium]
MHKRLITVAVYSIAHFIVDFSCAFLMFRNISASPDWYLCLLLYNFFAFAAQMPLGLIADRLNRNSLVAAAGCIFAGAAYALWRLPMAAAATAGIGNAMFHIGGGLEVLNMSEKKSAALGVFVSPGTFGIYFGTLLGKGGALSPVLVIFAMFLAAAGIFALCGAQPAAINNAAFSLEPKASDKIYIAVVFMFLVVVLRSYVGLTLNFPWKIGGWATAVVFAAALGKTLGGFSADKFGARRTAVFSLGLAAPLFLFLEIPVLGVIAVLLFNMSMSVTLWAMAKIFPGAKGFSFGLLTFALFLGFVPVYLDFGPSMPRLFSAAAAISLLLLWAGLKKADI